MTLSKTISNVVVLFLVALIISGCGGAEQRKAKYLERGKDYLEQQNYDKAIVEFKNVLQIDPKYAEAYSLLGQAEEGRHEYQRAFGFYYKAIDLNPDQFEARTHIARFYILGGALDKAKEQIDAVLAKQPKNTSALLLQAVVASREGKDEEAIKEANAIIKTVPTETGAYGLVADIFFKQKKLDKSVEILSQGIAANPKDISLRVHLATVYAEKGDNDKAAEILQQCVSLEPKNMQLRANLAGFLARTNQLDKAEKVLRTAIEQDPSDDVRRMLLVDFLFEAKKDTKGAEQELLNSIREIPDSSKLRFGLASLYERLNDPAKAMDVYHEIISRYEVRPEGLRARNKLAALLVAQGKNEEAKKLTDEVLNENPTDNDALLAKAKYLLAKQDAQGAITALRTVLRDQPNLTEASIYLAEAHLMNKEPALAKESLLKAAELNPKDVKIRLALAKYYAKTKDLASAIKTVDEALKVSPNDYDAMGARYELLLLNKDMKGAQGELEKIKAAYPDKPTGYYLLGQLYAKERKFDAAEREFKLGLSRFQGSYQFTEALVKVYLAQKKPEKAVAFLNDLLANEPLSRQFAHELVAEVYLRQKKYNEAEQSLRKEIEANPKWNIPYATLASIYIARGDFSSAEKAYQEGLKIIPDDPQLSMSMAGMYERSKKYDKAIAVYEQIVSKQSGNNIAANNLATLLLDHSTDSGSLKRAMELATRFETSDQPVFLDTLGWTYYRSGDTDKAIDVLENVVKKAPKIGIFRYHLGMAYYKKGDNASAKTQLAKAVEAKQTFDGIDEARATLKQIQ